MSTKFSIFKIFKKKLSVGLQKMVDTKDKLEYIRDHYQDEVDKYVKSLLTPQEPEGNVKSVWLPVCVELKAYLVARGYGQDIFLKCKLLSTK